MQTLVGSGSDGSMAYLEELVHDGSCGSREEEVRVPSREVCEPEEAVVRHARHRKFSHCAQTPKHTEADPHLHEHEAAHGEDAAHVGLQNGGLLHSQQLLLLLVAALDGIVELLLDGRGDGLHCCHCGHLVGAHGLEVEGYAADCDAGDDNGAGPAPARVQVDLLDGLFEEGGYAPAVVEAQLFELSGVVDEGRGVKVGFCVLHGLEAEKVVHRLGVFQLRGETVGGRRRSRSGRGVYYGRFVYACGRNLWRGRCDGWFDIVGGGTVHEFGHGDLLCARGSGVTGGRVWLAPAPGRVP